MLAYTLNRQFQRQEVVDAFNSFIWTERYYGDSECQLVVPATKVSLDRFPVGTFLELEGSQEIMMLEVDSIEDGKATITGISLMKWMNNRFTRGPGATMADRYYNIPANFMGVPQMLWQIFQYCVITPGPDGIPAPDKARLLIPNIILKSYEDGPPYPGAAVPFGPVYDVLKEIAEAYQVGMSLTLEDRTSGGGYTLGFMSYRGKDRTRAQTVNPVVQFSPEMDSLTDTKELVSITDYKTEAWAFVPSNPGGLATTPGHAVVDGAAAATGFDLRAIMVFADDITTDTTGGSAAAMLAQLDQRAKAALGEHPYVAHIDGEIVPTGQFRYGVDYSLGDVIEIAGSSGTIQNARVTEYIRSHDETGERAYPTVTMIT